MLEHPEAAGPFRTLVNKLIGCGAQCNWGSHWNCIGEFSWESPPPGTTMQVTVSLGRAYQGLPVSTWYGVVTPTRVSAATLDDNGEARVEWSQHLEAYLRVDGLCTPVLVFLNQRKVPSRVAFSLTSRPGPCATADGGAAPVDADAAGTGIVQVQAYDCVGSLNATALESSGVTFRLTSLRSENSVVQPLYSNNQSQGNVASFFEVPDGFYYIEAFMPGERSQSLQPVRVERDVLTVMFMNFPVVQVW
jgi:hypothetical protein